MNKKYSDMPLIDLTLNFTRNKELKRLYTQKSILLNDWLQHQKEKGHEYFEKAIQWWKINAILNNIKWDSIIESILNEKLDYLSKIFDCKEWEAVDIFIKKCEVRFSLEQKKLNPTIPFDNEHYLSLLLRFIEELPIKLQHELDAIKKTDIELLALDYQKQLNIVKMHKAKTLKLHQKDIDKIYANMLSDYDKYIELLAIKMNLIITKLNSFDYCDPIEKINDELSVFNLKFEIEAKKTYRDYFAERNF